MVTIRDKLKNAWNPFKRGREPIPFDNIEPNDMFYGMVSDIRSPAYHLTRTNAKTVINKVFTRLAIDVSMLTINHIRVNDEDDYVETLKDSYNKIFTLAANKDQPAQSFIRDIVLTMCDNGAAALVPIDTDVDPNTTDSYEIYSVRVGKIVEWYPDSIKVEVYNDRTGQRQQKIFAKRICPIIENPFYTTMNEPNSDVQRLLKLLSQLDLSNTNNSNPNINLLIQYPYPLKNQSRIDQAELRRNSLEKQFNGKNNSYGIGYIDSTEKVIQLNKAIENNLWEQAEKLTLQIFNQLGMSKDIFEGTADEQQMLNYYNSSIEPIISAICQACTMKWISQTAYTQGQRFRYFREAFKLTTVEQMTKAVDTYTRSQVLTANEVRTKIGMKPKLDDHKANELRNPNINHPEDKIEVEKQLNGEKVDIKEDVEADQPKVQNNLPIKKEL